MKVFISWSGERSKAVAEALRYWLPKVIQNLEPWLSAADMEKGTRWRSEIASQLEQSDIGIICLTPENLAKPWVLFEAGALSKKQQDAYVCTFLYELNPADVKEPLAQFQATKATEEDIRGLIKTINSALPQSRLSESDVDEIFNVWWPKLEERLKNISRPQDKLEAQRDEREILEEILELVRSQARQVSPLALGLNRTKPRLLTTLDWSPEDAQLLYEYYEQANSVLKERLAGNESFAQLILTLLKAERAALSKTKQAETEPNTNSVLADQETGKSDEDSNSQRSHYHRR
jgi:hypothetical protein